MGFFFSLFFLSFLISFSFALLHTSCSYHISVPYASTHSVFIPSLYSSTHPCHTSNTYDLFRSHTVGESAWSHSLFHDSDRETIVSRQNGQYWSKNRHLLLATPHDLKGQDGTEKIWG
ncbi:hypothetical protein BJX65DRAFT_184058 [Aspergillus insuetus]